MKHSLYILATLPFLASCSNWDDLISRDVSNPELPGVPTQINCNPEPTLIYSKAGDLIDTVIPVLHPSCTGQVLGETVELEAPWWSIFGPPSTRASFFPTESLDKDDNVNPRNVATNTPEPTTTPDPTVTPTQPDPNVTPETPTPTVDPQDPTDPTKPVEPQEPTEPTTPVKPEPKPEPEGGCNGAMDCEPDSKTQKEEYERWREDVKRNKNG